MVNALTGAPITSFADSGRLSLHSDLGEGARDRFVIATSPGMIYKDMIIIGSRVSEDADAAPGHIRSYDVRTGKLRWIFHTIPQPGRRASVNGKIRRPINSSAAPMPGLVLAWTKNAVFFSLRPAPPLLIFMAANV
ncbi:hypothetical protein MKQ70_00575 [Chitinophaga sedimenti]|nr:hypothetical protein [Chitinophaga sedimenti]MCK7553577.1 hypothetical protein [Chitinophaga sedimenti]